MKIPARFLVLGCLGMLVLLAGGCLALSWLATASPARLVEVLSPIPTRDVSRVTSPLEPETIRDICQKFDLAADDPRCQQGAVVYAPQFFDLVYQAFKPGTATYRDVYAKLGAYEDCDSPVVISSGTVRIRCNYDFRGDRVYAVTIFFTGPRLDDATVDSIHDNGVYTLP